MTPPAAEVQSPRLNATAAALLGLLLDRPMTGWDLIAAAQERIGEFWSLTQSQVYRELTTMADRGLVSAGPPGPRDRKPYAVTVAGRSAFAEWLHGEPGADQVRIPLLLMIAFAGHLPAGRLAEIIEAQRDVHAERLERYLAGREQMTAAPEVDVMVVRAELAVRGRPERTDGPTAAYLEHIGFTLIALADGFAVVAAIRSGAPGWVVGLLAVGVVVVGHLTLQFAKRRLVHPAVVVTAGAR